MSKPSTVAIPERRARLVPLRMTAVRDNTETGGKTLSGHAAVFDQLSEDLNGFREKIARGAFRGCLSDDVRATINHDPNLVLGRSTSGTLRLVEDRQGLGFEVDLPDTDYAVNLRELMGRGDVSQCSFMFSEPVIREQWEYASDDSAAGDALPIRTILEFDRLFDVSVVTYPAYPQTDAEIRRQESKQTLRLHVPSRSIIRGRPVIGTEESPGDGETPQMPERAGAGSEARLGELRAHKAKAVRLARTKFARAVADLDD